MIPEIETDRLILRGPKPEDLPVYESFFTDEKASAGYGGPRTAGQAWRNLALDIGHWTLRGYGRWAVIEKQSGEMVGSCGLWWPQGYPRSELTWWIISSARRKGYAKEASIAAIQHGYNDLGWSIVETHMKDDNHAARHLVESLGGTVIARESFPDGLERNIYKLPQ